MLLRIGNKIKIFFKKRQKTILTIWMYTYGINQLEYTGLKKKGFHDFLGDGRKSMEQEIMWLNPWGCGTQ